jgi:hypothetical protein
VTTSDLATDLIEVRLLALPLELHNRVREHSEELQREFALIHHGRSHTDSEVPSRLLDLVADLRARFAAFSSDTYAEMDAALARGEKRRDVTFVVPRAAGPAAVAVRAMFDEADEFCRSGELLTLATPEELVAYRRWFLDEFTRQAQGHPPRPWGS